MTTIGERIKFLRKEHHISQEALGQMLGVQLAAVSKYETGRVIPDEKTLKLICATYNVNYQWLTQGKEPIYLRPEGEELITKYAPDALEHTKNAIRVMSGLPDRDWEALRDFVDDLLRIVEGNRKEP